MAASQGQVALRWQKPDPDGSPVDALRKPIHLRSSRSGTCRVGYFRKVIWRHWRRS